VSSNSARSRVVVMSLGGTIASVKSTSPGASTTVTPQLGARDLVNEITQLGNVADIDTVAFRTVPSGNLTFADLVALAAEIKHYFNNGADGVVVTQGTDTIEETSFALDLLVQDPHPVVVTGAMRNPTMAGPDGPANVLAAVQVAASPAAKGLGTLVVFNDEIHAARFVRKTHAISTATFRSPSAGPIGWVIEGEPRILFRLSQLDGLSVSVGDSVPPVALFTVTLGDDDRILGQISSLGYGGVIVEAFGAGHVPEWLVGALQELARTMPVVLTSRTGAGGVLSNTYGFPGSESDLLSREIISGGLLDGRKARVFLSLWLAAGNQPTSAKTAFGRLNASLTSFPI
jgi:L-asparaginase